MSLDEAIRYYSRLADECRRKANIERYDYMDLKDLAAEHGQLADWLNELKVLREKIRVLLEKQEEDRWIPVAERLPETTDPVNVTWANNDPVSYYEDIRGKRFTATACYHRGKWWWYSAVCQDLLDEYGKSCMDDEIDEAIEILAWRPLPEPYKAEDEA